MLTTASVSAEVDLWTPWSFDLLQHEFGVTTVDWSEPEGGTDADDVRTWLARHRGRGRGRVMPLHELVPRAGWRWYQASRPAALRRVRAAVLVRLCALLNDPRSDLSIVELLRQR